MAELEARLTWPELQEWREFDRLEPLPDPWLIGASQMALIANAMAAFGRARRTFKPADFYPGDLSEAPAQASAPAPAELWARILTWADAFKG